ncbi:MAG TPA: menaquinone biosynthesis protein [Phycisphaerae bacterium]|nr:menaquinone biosynthesis protein [Phycisphaerae bacterium]
MDHVTHPHTPARDHAPRPGAHDYGGAKHRVGCVSFLNSKPLIDPLLARPDVRIEFAVPSRLLEWVETDRVSTALLSVVDFQLARHDLLLVPAGMIGCDGPTLTVRVFSRVAPERIREIHGDTDSHTSVVLARLILQERYGNRAPLVPFADAARRTQQDAPETMLLIGDKVVNAAPDAALYPHQLDLGEEWKHLTGLPFVFAMWMMRRDQQSTELAALLAAARRRGADMTDDLVRRYAQEKRWPPELARRYFTEFLRYEVTDRARAGLARFFDMADRAGLVPRRRELAYLDIPA